MKSGNSHRLLLGTGGALVLATLLPAAADVIAAWETTGQSSFGTQGLAATTSAPGVSVGGLTRGPGTNTSGGTSTANAWGAQGFDAATVEEAAAAGNFITFTVTSGSGAGISFETFDLHYRRDGSGPELAALQFQIGSGGFIDVEEFFLVSGMAGGVIDPIDLTGYEDLQGVTGQTVTFRLIPYGTTDPGDNFFVYGPIAGADLVVEGQVTGGSGGDTAPPLVNGLSPADDSTGVSAAGTTLLTMTFNENLARGTGQILVKNTLSELTVYSLDVTNPAQVTLSSNQIGLVLPAALAAGTDYHVEIPAGAIVDLASPANPYAGIAGSSGWNFTTAVVVTPPRVVVNKYFNGSPDRVELLVIGNGTPGATVDLRGMILKDFSGDMSGDAGGKYLFANSTFWSAVPAGTLVTLSNATTSSDLAAGDYTLALGLGDPVYFSLVPGSPSLDITATDMVMITLAALFASPETYEGRLVTVKNLTYDSGVWGPAASITLRDSSLTPVEIRIQSGSTATSPPPFPATVTGIFSQSDATAPFDSGYQILPRDSGDLIAWVDDFVTWTTTTGATGGPTGDPDFDGKDNSFEYAFGLNPTSGSSSNPVISGLNPSSGKFTYTRRSLALTDRDVQVFTSTNLTGWTEDTTATESVISTAGQVETVEVTLSAPKPLTAPTLFFRVELN
jgi:hypothetical protein